MAARAADACRALRGAIHAKLTASYSRLRSRWHSSLGGAPASAAFVAALFTLLCVASAFPRAVASVLPLAATTALCCAAAGLFAADERGATAKEAVEGIVAVGQGKRPEPGLVQVIDEANASAYGGGGGGVQVGCFLRRSERSGVDEDGEEVVFAGKLAPCVAGDADGVEVLGHGGGLEEEVEAMRVDRIAEVVWNSYFGGWSTWHDIDAAA